MPSTNPAKTRTIHAVPPRYTFHMLKTRRCQKISLGLAALVSQQGRKAAPPLHSGATPPITPPQPRYRPRGPSRGRPGLAKRCPAGHGRFRASARAAAPKDVDDARVRATSRLPQSMSRRRARAQDPAPMLRNAHLCARPACRPRAMFGPAARSPQAGQTRGLVSLRAGQGAHSQPRRSPLLRAPRLG